MAHVASTSEFFSPVVRRYRIAGLSLTLLRQRERRELPSHGHRNAYFSFLMSGSYRERVGNSVLEPGVPAVVFHPSDLEHADAYGPEGGQILAIEMEPSWLSAWGAPAVTRSAPKEIEGEGVLPGAWALHLELASSGVPLALTIENHVAELVAELVPAVRKSEPSYPHWLRRVVEKLHAEFADPPSMSALAHDNGVHPAHLSRTFRRYLGCSPTTFVHRQRVRHVWRRLTRDDAPSLAEVALEAGFSDQSHCTRVFRRLVGSPPGAFLRRIDA